MFVHEVIVLKTTKQPSMYSIVNFQVSVFDFPLDQTCARLIVRALNKHFNLPHCEDMTYLHASDWADKTDTKETFL